MPRKLACPAYSAPVVQWIEREIADLVVQVRFLAGALCAGFDSWREQRANDVKRPHLGLFKINMLVFLENVC